MDETQTHETATPESPAPDESSSSSSELSEILNGLGHLAQKLDVLQQRFDQKARQDTQRDDTIKRLHDDLDRYRQGITLPVLRPFAEESAKIYEALRSVYLDYAGFIDGSSEESQKAHQNRLNNLENILIEIEESLHQQGFTLYHSSEGSEVDPSLHMVLEVKNTDDDTLDKRIAVSRKTGLSYQRSDGNQMVIRPEQVIVYKYQT